MEQNKIPTPPKEMRRVPPPPPKPASAPAAPKAVPVVENEQAKEKVVVQKPVEKVAEPVVEEVKASKVKESKKLKKESAQEEGDLDNIGLVDVRQTKKVDSKAMLYYVGIFVSLALMAVIIFLILK